MKSDIRLYHDKNVPSPAIMKINRQVKWHYTTLDRLQSIMEDGVIRFATELIHKKEKPAVWVSSNPFWEYTANKGILKNGIIRTATLEEMIHIAGGLARIQILDTLQVISWAKFKYVSGIPEWLYYRLQEIGYESGANPTEWFVSFKPITEEFWGKIEVNRGDKWERYF